jgi:hypothetical protein
MEAYPGYYVSKAKHALQISDISDIVVMFEPEVAALIFSLLPVYLCLMGSLDLS